LFNVQADTIAAIATPPGVGGIGVIRISGPAAASIAARLGIKKLPARQALYSAFKHDNAGIIDTGIALFFPAPHSYTGEDVLELQGHGGAVVLNMLLKSVLASGARLARPGEFTERAFLNNKIDLVQAEAVADLIESSTEHSVRSAQLSLQGVFSDRIHELVEELIELRTYVEASIDFVDEDIDFLSDGIVEDRINRLLAQIGQILKQARQGRLLQEGMTIVLAGRPNAGKSSLLNALAGYDAAIVTDIPGTTRDLLREHIQIDGMPLHIIDTAGLRESDNPIEQEGIRRAYDQINKAHLVLLIIDCSQAQFRDEPLALPLHIPILTVYNKIDLTNDVSGLKGDASGKACYLSIKTGQGLDLLKRELKARMGFNDEADTVFTARIRHIEALEQASLFTTNALTQLQTTKACELIAEELRQAQNCLASITGEVTSDDLLGHIFSSFCIGK
jgi:tRNA modification GTPase